ncbi:MAG: xanthine dehydrogenase [Rhodospirillales bacterium]|nr:xanthine dehydrogenase [Rhodospirillales bacterium]
MSTALARPTPCSFQQRFIRRADPGNFATNIQAGGEVRVHPPLGRLLANLVAMLFQALSAKLGNVTGRNLDHPHGSPLGSKGIGELGICGAGAAVMNAIHNTTGARIRDFPASPDKLLATLETLDG